MAYDTERKQYSKIPFQFIEIEVDAVVTRFYDYNYQKVIANFDGVPTLKSFTMSPAKIDINGGIGIRATGAAVIGDHHDYTVYGTASAPVRYWAAWTAKNRDYRYQRVSHFSGYIVNDAYVADNFVQRDFIIETMAWGADGVNMSLRDPLMLANDSTSKLPVESTGELAAAIDNVVTSFSLLPAGIGADYPASDFYVIINEEVMYCSSRTVDAFTVVRGSYGTVAEEQPDEAKVQLCLFFDASTVADMGYHLLTVGANVDPIYINKATWDARSANAFPNLYTMLVTKPTGIRKLLKEICDTAPHYYFYDTRSNEIQFKAQEAPQDTGQILTYDANLLMGKTVVKDRKDLQITTVVIYYDIRNPVKDLEEASNYAKVYVREDTAAILANGGSRAYKTIYSRSIGTAAKSAAVLAASLTGRRFAVAPLEITYQLDPKDAEVWTGDAVRIESDLVLNPTSLVPDLRVYQIVAANENTETQRLSYTALEHTYGDAVDGDDDVENPNVRLVYISGENDRLASTTAPDTPRSLREYYESTWGATVLANYDIRFIVEVGAVVGSSVNSDYAMTTGTWPELTTPPLIINNNLIIGKGGNGANVSGTAEAGGSAILLENDIRLNNIATIGSGGGGGNFIISSDVTDAEAAGGGGAGFTNGLGGTGSGPNTFTQAQDSTNTLRGDGAFATSSSTQATGGRGGNLGAIGQFSGGAAGSHAINQNGFVITYINTGTILGTITP